MQIKYHDINFVTTQAGTRVDTTHSFDAVKFQASVALNQRGTYLSLANTASMAYQHATTKDTVMTKNKGNNITRLRAHFIHAANTNNTRERQQPNPHISDTHIHVVG